MANPHTLSRRELLPELPESMRELWPHQKRPIEHITRMFREGASMVVLDAPPGAGKSLIAESVRRELGVQALYLCQTKVLQDQLARTFPYARVIKGRENYPSLDDFARTAKECDAWRRDCKAKRGCYVGDAPHCSFCHPMSMCPYNVAKEKALRSPLAVANTSYAFLEWGAAGQFRDWDLVVLDEWDEVENVLFNTLNVAMTLREMARFRVSVPRHPDAAWTKDAADQVAAYRDAHRDNPPDDWPRIGELASSLRLAAEGLRDRSWIVLAHDDTGIQIGPIEVGALGHKYLWPNAKRWLLMSGTAIDARLRLKKLGWTDFGTKTRPGKGKVWKMGSVYPVENRPIKVWPVASMTMKNREESLPKLADAITQILDHHRHERVLVHTGTYAINAALATLLLPGPHGRRIETFAQSRERQDAIERFLRREAAVLMGPAMERGLSLDDDACRAIVVCRVPYPFRGDPRVTARAQEGGTWWVFQAIETIATLVQMTGRGMRHMNDHSCSYILDAQFKKIQTHGLYIDRWPAWWKESLSDFGGWR